MHRRVRVVALLVALVGLGDAVALVRHDPAPQPVAAPPPTTMATTTTTMATTTTLPPPPRVLFTRVKATETLEALPEVLSVAPDGTGLAPAAGPPAPATRVSGSAGVIVYSKPLSSTSRTGAVTCAFHACTQHGSRTMEAGIAASSVDGSNERILTSGGYDSAPAVSPDGRTIAFLRHIQAERQTVNALAFIDVEGGEVRSLVPKQGRTYLALAWSPDGASLAVTEFDSGLHRRDGQWILEPPDSRLAKVLLLGIEGSSRVIADGDFRELAWSHDGRRIAAMRHRLVPPPGDAHPGSIINTTGTDLWVITVDGSAPPRQITRLAPAKQIDADPCSGYGAALPQIGHPAWSRDDTQIAALSSYNHREDGNAGVRDVVVVNADGTGLRTVYAQPRACPEDKAQHLQLIGWS